MYPDLPLEPLSPTSSPGHPILGEELIAISLQEFWQALGVLVQEGWVIATQEASEQPWTADERVDELRDLAARLLLRP